MHVTWSAVQLREGAAQCPWQPEGARWCQTGQAGAGRAELPRFDGRWWSVLAVWDDDPTERAQQWPVADDLVDSGWHVVLAPASFRGDAVLSGGARPFAALPAAGRVTGAAAVLTLAGFGEDPVRTREFFERFLVLGGDVQQAPGHRAALIQAPTDGAVMTFSAWDSLRDAVTWAYHRPLHAETVHRQESHPLLATSGFLRCAVLASRGTLHGTDPLAGLTGAPVTTEHA